MYKSMWTIWLKGIPHNNNLGVIQLKTSISQPNAHNQLSSIYMNHQLKLTKQQTNRKQQSKQNKERIKQNFNNKQTNIQSTSMSQIQSTILAKQIKATQQTRQNNMTPSKQRNLVQ